MGGHKGDKVFVIGVGMTKFEKPGSRDWDYPDMGREAGEKALADAGIPYDTVEQAAIGYCYGDSTAGQAALYQLGLTGIPAINVNNNCSTGSSALYYAKKRFGLAFVDHTTGEFQLAEFDSWTALEDEIQRVAPSEILYSDEQVENFSGVGGSAFSYDGYAFLEEQANFTLKEHFKVQSLHGFG